MNIFQFLKFLLGTLLISNVSAWDQEELEIFDLVEEINENFYLILKVEQVKKKMFEITFNVHRR